MSGYKNDTNPSKLGGGVPGLAPILVNSSGSKGGSGMNGDNFRSQNRTVLRRAFGQAGWFRRALSNPNQPLVITPFRQSMNAGDLNGSVNSSPSSTFPAPSQVNSIGNSILNSNNADSVRNNGTAAYSGNPKYVYDSSDYARYKRLKNINRNYNDSSFGGDQHNGSYSFLLRVRR